MSMLTVLTSVQPVETGRVVVENLAERRLLQRGEVVPQIVVGSLGDAGRPRRHAGRMREVRLVEDVVGTHLLDGRQRRVALEPEASVDLPPEVLTGQQVVLRMLETDAAVLPLPVEPFQRER